MGDVLDLAAAEQPIRLIMSDRLPASSSTTRSAMWRRSWPQKRSACSWWRARSGRSGSSPNATSWPSWRIGGDVEREQVKTDMSVDLVTAAPTDSIAAVGRLMIDAGVRHVAVRGDDGRIAGVVSLRNVLAALLIWQL